MIPDKSYALKGLTLREPNGRLSRRANAAHEAVYIVRQEGSGRIKVGRTQNLKARMTAYESNSGVPVHYAMQLIVASRDDSKALEAHLIKTFGRRFTAFKREWFDCQEGEIFEALTEALTSSPVAVLSFRGGPSVERPFDLHRANANPVNMGRVLAR
nr:GIY-YIG nuclease family protein [Aminobacter aminovorans]